METSKHNTVDDCLICEGVTEATEDETLAAWQRLIDSGLVWQLQGFYGRTAQRLIERGLCRSRLQ